MKAQHLLTGLVCVAVGLLASIVYVKSSHRPPTVDSSASSPGIVQSAPAADSTSGVVSASAPAPSPGLSWRNIESEDYHRYIANLRAIGCPEQTIRDIIVADINKTFADRENPLKNPPKPPAGTAETPEQKLERLKQLRAVQQEKRWVVKELLNIDLPLDMLPSSGSRDYHAFEVALGFLPADKRDTVQTLQENYWQQIDALQTKYNKKKTPEFLAESRQLNESLRQELAKVLAPQELEDFDIRTSTTAKQLSDKLATYFRPTEAEFRQIYRAKRDYDETIERLSTPATPALPAAAATPADRQALAQQRAADRQALAQARTAASDQMNEQLKSTLGADRYTEYQRSQDRTYDLLARLGIRYNLPQDTVQQAYELQQSFKPNPGPVQNQGAQPDRAELQRQLNEQLTKILGDQAAQGYRRVHGGTVPLN